MVGRSGGAIYVDIFRDLNSIHVEILQDSDSIHVDIFEDLGSMYVDILEILEVEIWWFHSIDLVESFKMR